MFQRQFIRFAIVGVISNTVLYIAYLLLTLTIGLEHKLAMTAVYISGVILTFILNRSWSFQHSGVAHTAFIRYILAYVIGYFVNLGVLWLAVDRLQLPHQSVQAVAILLVAICMFLLHKYWVFAHAPCASN